MTMEFLPGVLLVKLEDMKDRTLYHQVKASGVAITVQKEGGTYRWRTLRYNDGDGDGWGEGSREQFKAWLARK